MNFVFSGWWKSFFPLPGVRAEQQDFNRLMRKLVARSRVIVAHDLVDEDALLGFAVIDGDTLHYVYTAQPFRGAGVARDLVGNGIKKFTHWSAGMRPPEGWEYDRNRI